MPLYRYTAASAGGTAALPSRGELLADSAEQVRSALRARGLMPLRVREVAAAHAAAESGDPESANRWRPVLARWQKRRRRAALVDVCERLAMMLASGVELSAALDSLSASRERGGKSPGARLCAQLAESVRAGAALADAMAERPGWFGPVECALVRAAEESGSLERALTDVADRAARADELRGKLAMALAYPAMLTVFGLGVVVFLTTTTLPQLASVLRDAGAQIPPATAALLGIGSLLERWWWLLVPALALAGLALVRAMASESAARARLRTPLLGPAILRGQLGAAAALLARLLDAGVPLTESLRLASVTLSNAALRTEFDGLAASITRGEAIGVAPPEGSALDPAFWSALRAGEESGELADALRRVGERMTRSAHRLIDRLAAALEPLVILLLAIGVGFVVYAAIAPMLRLTQTLGS